MLSRIPAHRFAARSLLSSLTCSQRRLLSDLPAATAATKDRRRWVMLSRYSRCCPDDSSIDADGNTMAECRTSKGQLVRVSLRSTAPPSSSYIYYDFPESTRVNKSGRIRVIGTHGELVLLKMYKHRSCPEVHYFVYSPAGTGRPPSLSLLPVPDIPTKPESVPASYFDPPDRCPRLDSGGIGLLRRGENDQLVVHADLCYDGDTGWQKAMFYVLRPGMCQWELKEPVPVIRHGSFSSPRNVICDRDRFLCWVWYSSGFLLCDMADDASPRVHYVHLPPEVRECNYRYNDNPARVQHMAAAGDSGVRFVSIHPNCCRSVDPVTYSYFDDVDCCCRESRTACWHPRFVFTIKTWTMNLSMEDKLEWLEDGEIDAEEIWALPGYEGLPHAIPQWPVMCLGEPNVVCFLVSNYHFTKDDEKVWIVQLNISTKTLLSVVQVTSNDDFWGDYYHLLAEIQY